MYYMYMPFKKCLAFTYIYIYISRNVRSMYVNKK